jgi:hypothetical protein
MIKDLMNGGGLVKPLYRRRGCGDCQGGMKINVKDSGGVIFHPGSSDNRIPKESDHERELDERGRGGSTRVQPAW